jgi:hypothetical protein
MTCIGRPDADEIERAMMRGIHAADRRQARIDSARGNIA